MSEKEPPKSETHPTETWVNGEPLEKVVDDAYTSQFTVSFDRVTGERVEVPIFNPGQPTETRDEIRERLRARLRVRGALIKKGLAAIGATEIPPEDHEDHLAFCVVAQEVTTRRYGGGGLGAITGYMLKHPDDPAAIRQVARALEVYAATVQVPLEQQALANKSQVLGFQSSTTLAQAAALRQKAAAVEASQKLAAETRARGEAIKAERAKAARRAEYDRIKALTDEFEGASA